MTDDSFVREFQRRAGLNPDGVAGSATMAVLDRVLPPRVTAPVTGLSRIVWHWTAGRNVVSDLDRLHYHFIVAGDGSVVPGKFKPEDNVNTADGTYAAHTLNCNTGAIGLSVAGMGDARERPFSSGAWPITEAQIAVLVGLTADLCRRYSIDVTPRTVLSHAEVQPTLGIAQRGKWDIAWLPGMAVPGDPVGIGNILRSRVLHQMKGA